MKTCSKCRMDCDDGVRFCPHCGQSVLDATPEDSDPYLGRVLGSNFRLEKQIGVGAMGTVYQATQLSLGKTVAVKILHRRLLGDPQLERRFHREAQAASRLSHPNTIRVIDYGTEEDGSLFIVMEFLEGKDLGSIIKQEYPLDWGRVVSLLIQVCYALEEAHEAGIIHRDLKPENIVVVRRRGNVELVKVLDFGIAKVQDAGRETPLTVAGMVCGTPEYMSPEQARGTDITARSDIYSLGVVLYQMLTGETLFSAKSILAIVTKQLSEAPQPPSERRPDVGIPPSLERLCLQTLAKDPQERPGSAVEMVQALRDVALELGAALLPEPGSMASIHGITPVPLAASVGQIGEMDPRPVVVPGALGGAAAHLGESSTPAARSPRRWGVLIVASLVLLLLLGLAGGGFLALRIRSGEPGGTGLPDLGMPLEGLLAGSQGRDVGVDGRVAAGEELLARADAGGGLAPRDATVVARAGDGRDGGQGQTREIVPRGPKAAASRPKKAAAADRGRTRADRGKGWKGRKGRKGRGKTRSKPSPSPAPAPESTTKELSGKELYARGRSLFREGKTKKAIKTYHKALRSRYRNPDIYYELGRCYARIRDHATSSKYYRKYTKVGRDPIKLRTAAAIVASAP